MLRSLVPQTCGNGVFSIPTAQPVLVASFKPPHSRPPIPPIRRMWCCTLTAVPCVLCPVLGCFPVLGWDAPSCLELEFVHIHNQTHPLPPSTCMSFPSRSTTEFTATTPPHSTHTYVLRSPNCHCIQLSRLVPIFLLQLPFYLLRRGYF